MECAIVFEALCTITDCAWKKIEGVLLICGALIGAAAAIMRTARGETHWFAVAASLAPGALLLGCSLLTEGKIGRGDADMIFVLGLLLGWELCTAALCISCLLTAAYAGTGIAAGRLRKDSRLPFAPFLLSGLSILWIFILLNGG